MAVRTTEPIEIASGVWRLGTELVNWYVVDAEVLGFGHGEPWRGGVAAAVQRAREIGPT